MRPIFLRCLIFLSLTVLNAVGFAQSPLLLHEQKEMEVKVKSITAEGNWTVENNQTTNAFTTDQIVRYGQLVVPKKGQLAVLQDGTELVLFEPVIEKRKLKGLGDIWDSVEFSIRNVRGLVLQLPIQPVERRRLIDLVKTYQDSQDQVILINGDRLTGLISRYSTKPEDKNDTLQIRTTGGIVEVEATRISALMFAPSSSLSITDQKVHWVGLRDGSLLACKSYQWQNDILTLTLSDGTNLESFPGINLQKEVAFIQPYSQKVTFLSQVEPLDYKHIPFLQMEWQYQTDRNVQGGTLANSDVHYLSGIGVHSTSRLAYRVPEDARRFVASVGIDDETAGQGSVRFRVYTASAAGKWALAFQSGILRGDDPLVPVSIELNQIKAIALVVDQADQADILDHANWVEARFEK